MDSVFVKVTGFKPTTLLKKTVYRESFRGTFLKFFGAVNFENTSGRTHLLCSCIKKYR